jgi:GNAT superfamily N-acetyltransferase
MFKALKKYITQISPNAQGSMLADPKPTGNMMKSLEKDVIPGGLADKKSDKDFNKKNLKEGIKVEKEHTSDSDIAKEIAEDHLTEDPKYYKKLATIEKSESFNFEELKAHLNTDEEANNFMNRIEDKYLASRSSLDYLTQVLKENLKEGDIDTEVRYNTNRSIYLDNKDLDSLKSGLNKVIPRLKVRIRQYAPNENKWENIAYLELKAKNKEGLTNKIRVRIFSSSIKSISLGEALEVTPDLVNINKDISADLLRKRVAYINNIIQTYGLKEQIEVNYERRAYTGKNVRVTIDDNLRYLNPQKISEEVAFGIKASKNWIKVSNLNYKLKNDRSIIIEVKYEKEVPSWLKKLLKDIEAKPVKFSKYCSAMTSFLDSKKEMNLMSSLQEDYSLNKAENKNPYGKVYTSTKDYIEANRGKTVPSAAKAPQNIQPKLPKVPQTINPKLGKVIMKSLPFGMTLQKGAMRRLAPFKPEDTKRNTMSNMSDWQTGEEPLAREALKDIGMDPNARKRALHKLSAVTPTRKVADGKREFLLHRGMDRDEFENNTFKDKSGKRIISHKNIETEGPEEGDKILQGATSWTPHLKIAHSFKNNYEGNIPKYNIQGYQGKDKRKPAGITSAWIHENNIAFIPKQYGHPEIASPEVKEGDIEDRKNPYAQEHEVIVKPNHSSELVHRNEVEKLLGIANKNDPKFHKLLAPKNIDQQINRRAKAVTGPISSEGVTREYAQRRFKKSELAKGQNGDWQKEGYKISHSGSLNDGNFTIHAHDIHGNKVGHSQIDKEPNNMIYNSFIRIEDAHQRKGLGSAMLAHAEKVTGKKLSPTSLIEDTGFSSPGKAIWDNPNRSFGKSELAKGQNGDWQKEGYSIEHYPHQDESLITIHAKDRNGKKVGEAHFTPYFSNHKTGIDEKSKTHIRPYHDTDNFDEATPAVDVRRDHRRKGLASAMYAHAEKISGKKIKDIGPENRTSSGRALWNQKNRQFGKSEKFPNEYRYAISHAPKENVGQNLKRAFDGIDTTDAKHYYEVTALHHGKPVGSVSALAYDNGDLQIAGAGLNEEHQNRGVGRAMYEKLYQTAALNGHNKIISSFPSEEARRVHEAIGKKHGLTVEKKFGGANLSYKNPFAKNEPLAKAPADFAPSRTSVFVAGPATDLVTPRSERGFEEPRKVINLPNGLRYEHEEDKNSFGDVQHNHFLIHPDFPNKPLAAVKTKPADVANIKADIKERVDYDKDHQIKESKVDPDHAGKGYGKQLYSAILRHFVPENGKLWSDKQTSANAQKAWESFRPKTGVRGYIGPHPSTNPNSNDIEYERKPNFISIPDHSKWKDEEHFPKQNNSLSQQKPTKMAASEMAKSNYGPKGMKLYSQADNARRKQTQNTSSDQEMDIQGIKVKIGANTVGEQGKDKLNRENKEIQIKNKKQPVKIFSPEEKEALAQKMGLKKSVFGIDYIMIMNENFNDNENYMAKGRIKEALLAGTLALSPAHLRPEPQEPKKIEVNQTSKPSSPINKDKFSQRMLASIRHVESSDGKNTNHAIVNHGLNAGTSAAGVNYGIMPLTIFEIVKKNPEINKNHPNLMKLKLNEVKSYLNKHPGLEDKLANSHLQRLRKIFGDDPVKIGYSWLQGISKTKKDLAEGKDISKHWHSAKIMKAFKNQNLPKKRLP